MKVLLVTMPWASLHRPSLALGLLTASAKKCKHLHKVDEMHGNLKWSEYILTHGNLFPTQYTKIADGYFAGAGDWVFTNALYGVSQYQLDEFSQFAEREGFDSGDLAIMHQLAPEFIQNLANEILEQNYDIIGFSSTFLQNVPSLSLAKELKKRDPNLIIIFGGGNCDGIQGSTLHRNFPFIDIVVRGEGESAFVDLLDLLETGEGIQDVKGICWRKADGTQVINGALASPAPMDKIPSPDYYSYFNALEESKIEKWVEPELILEASRGCWWGEKHQCTFCGLNGSFIQFRRKSPERFWDELKHAITKYRVLDVSLADNILDMKYFNTLLPEIAKSDWDLRMFCEIKANLSPDHVEKLKSAGVVGVQPGIESLSSHVLKLMDKGVSGVQNIRLLRDCEGAGLTVDWNYLYGFPGERKVDYTAIINQMNSLVHLQPPAAAYRVALERFSPYFDNPSLGFENRGPAKIYSYIYQLPEKELKDMVYLFESKEHGISGNVENNLVQMVNDWKKLYKESVLYYRMVGNDVVIFDRRRNWPKNDYVLQKQGEAEAYKSLQKGNTLLGLQRVLEKKYAINVEQEQLTKWINHWQELGLVFADDGKYVALATEKTVLHGDDFLKVVGA